MQERAIEEPKLDNARRLRGVYFIVPGDVEFHQKTSKNLRKKLEVPMEATIPCNIWKTKMQGTCAGPDIRNSRYACIVEANESTRKRLEGTQHKDYEELIASKGFKSLSHLQSCAQVHPFVSRTENTRSESRSGQIMEKLEDLPAWQLTKVRSKKRSFRRHTEKEEQSISLHWWTFAPRIHGPRVCSREGCWLQFAPRIHGPKVCSREGRWLQFAPRLSQCLVQVFIGSIHCFNSLLRFMESVH